MPNNTSKTSETTTDSEFEDLGLLLLNDLNSYTTEVNQLGDNLLKSTFLDYLENFETVVTSGILLPNFSKNLWGDGYQNWFGFFYEPDLFTNYSFSGVNNFDLNGYLFNPKNDMGANFMGYYEEVVNMSEGLISLAELLKTNS